MTARYQPQPGDILLCQITGLLGLLIRLGQGLAGDWSRYTHVAVVLPGGKVIGAQPKGARIDPIESILGKVGKAPVAVLRIPAEAEHLRGRVVEIALSYDRRRYGYLSYLWIALKRFGIKPEWLKRRIASDRAVICSDMADRIYEKAGIRLINDSSTLRGEVTPGDLAHAGTVTHLGAEPVVTA